LSYLNAFKIHITSRIIKIDRQLALVFSLALEIQDIINRLIMNIGGSSLKGSQISLTRRSVVNGKTLSIIGKFFKLYFNCYCYFSYGQFGLLTT
jgi:hypothetical protein